MGRQILIARILKGVGELMIFDSLQRVANCGAVIAVIDDQANAALRRQLLGA